MIGSRWIAKPGRLMHIHSLLKITVKKRILHIKLSNGPLVSDSDAKNSTNGGRLDDRAERLITIDTGSLTSSVSNKMGLISR